MTKHNTLAKLMMVALVIAFSLGFASQASAIPILLDQSSSRYLGLINDGIPSNPAAEVSYINILIGLAPGTGPVLIGTENYTRSLNACVPACTLADIVGTIKDESESNDGNFGAGFTYLIAKYDAGNAGSLVWDVRGLTGDFEVQATLNNRGVSHWALYTPFVQTPEPMTLTLIGVGLAGLGLVYRRRSR